MLDRYFLLLIVVTRLLAPFGSVLAAPCWQPPVAGVIVDSFRTPDCHYCAGNRGIEYRAPERSPVRSVEAGIVTYSGSIAGTRYVVVELASGWRITYGKLESASVQRGDRIARDALVGQSTESLYFGLRVDDEYRDPAPYLGRPTGRPRLVPVDGHDRRTPPPAVWRCPS